MNKKKRHKTREKKHYMTTREKKGPCDKYCYRHSKMYFLIIFAHSFTMRVIPRTSQRGNLSANTDKHYCKQHSQAECAHHAFITFRAHRTEKLDQNLRPQYCKTSAEQAGVILRSWFPFVNEWSGDVSNAPQRLP